MTLDAPFNGGELTFMKHCRLSVLQLSSFRIHTKGMLWKVSKEIRTYKLSSTKLFSGNDYSHRDLYRLGLNRYERSRLWSLVHLLRSLYYKQLPSDLEHYLTDEIPLYLDEWPSRFCLDMMAY